MGKYHPLRYRSSPVKFSTQQVIDYPFHWHDCIEVIFVMKGSILLELIKDPALVNPMLMCEKDIYVATMNEIHRIYKTEEENTVLLMQIDAGFVRRHFAGVDVIEFSCLFNPDTNIEREKIQEIKEQVFHLSRLILNAAGKNSAEIERVSYELLFNLIENFNIINRALARVSERKKYIARFTRISNYIINNFNNKNVLQEIAEREYLDADYISHELKRYFGSSFQVAINFYRIENSMRLLLDSELTIDQIAYECGFSAPKYFYKNFKIYYAQGPLAFRQRYKKQYENMKYLQCYQETDIPAELLSRTHKSFETEIAWLEIDINERSCPIVNHEADTIYIGRGEDLCNVLVQNSLKLIQSEIGFKYIKIKNLFPSPDSFWGNAVEGIYYYLHSVEFLWQLGIKPVIQAQDTCFENAVYRKILRELIDNFAEKYGWDSLTEWNFEIEKRSGVKYDILADIVKPCSVCINKIDDHSGVCFLSPLNDTFYMACDIVDRAVNGKRSMDPIYPTDYGEAGLPKPEYNMFQGKNGLMTVNGLLKPSFYAYFLLAQLGSHVIKKGDYYFVSKKGDTIQILLYNHTNFNSGSSRQESLPEDYYKNLLGQMQKKINLNIRNVQDTYKVTRYELNYENNCIYYQWLTMRSPKLLSDHEIKLLNKVTFPKVSFDFIDKKDVNFNISLPPDGIELVILEKQ